MPIMHGIIRHTILLFSRQIMEAFIWHKTIFRTEVMLKTARSYDDMARNDSMTLHETPINVSLTVTYYLKIPQPIFSSLPH